MFNDAYRALPEKEFKSLVLQQLFREFDGGQGTITLETAREVQFLALRGLDVCGDGWKAAIQALSIASQLQEKE